VVQESKRARRRGSVFVISAPSGSGKSTLVKQLLNAVPGLVFSVSYTTRPRRGDEKQGKDYFFVTQARFRRMIASSEFVEWAEVHGHLYGTSRKQVRRAQTLGKDVLLDIDVQGHRQVRRSLPDAVSIFVLPPSFTVLQRRLRGRHSEAEEIIRRRLVNARKEIRRWREYDYLIVNGRLSRATQAIRAVVEGARLRRSVQEHYVRQILKTFGGKIE
jgi:guanylate kinase